MATLLTYLQHFDPSTNIYLGERYGYQLLSSNGFNYITGGGGIVFSLSVIEKLVENCRCPSPSSPDDMIIGLCLQYAGIEPIHSSRFHQVNENPLASTAFLIRNFIEMNHEENEYQLKFFQNFSSQNPVKDFHLKFLHIPGATDRLSSRDAVLQRSNIVPQILANRPILCIREVANETQSSQRTSQIFKYNR